MANPNKLWCSSNTKTLLIGWIQEMNMMFSKWTNCLEQYWVPHTTVWALSHPVTLKNISSSFSPVRTCCSYQNPWIVSQILNVIYPNRSMYTKTCWHHLTCNFICLNHFCVKQKCICMTGHTRNQLDAKPCQTEHSSVQQNDVISSTRKLVYSFKEKNLRL